MFSSSHSSPSSTVLLPQTGRPLEILPSLVHVAEHPSPVRTFPSSQSSPSSALPLPQPTPPETEGRFVPVQRQLELQSASFADVFKSADFGSHSSPISSAPLPQTGAKVPERRHLFSSHQSSNCPEAPLSHSSPFSTLLLPQTGISERVPSLRHRSEHPSPFNVFPSSQSSPVLPVFTFFLFTMRTFSTAALPQTPDFPPRDQPIPCSVCVFATPSLRHLALHPSLLAMFLSSQSSPKSKSPLPHRLTKFDPSWRQVSEHPSPFFKFPSSQSSPESGFPFPQAIS